MKKIFLSLEEVRADLLLEPQEDTLYVLPPQGLTADIRLDLATPEVRAFMVGLFKTAEEQKITVKQNHLAPHTESHVLLKSLVAEGGNFSYHGNISIAKEAGGSNASQEARGLLLGQESRFTAIPSLEIFPKNVICGHKASSTPVNTDSLYTLQSRGLAEDEAKELLENAFLKNAKETLAAWGIPDETIQEVAEKLLATEK